MTIMSTYQHKDYNDLSAWFTYIRLHMDQSVVTKGMFQTTVKTKDERYLAIWQISQGLGWIREFRGTARNSSTRI